MYEVGKCRVPYLLRKKGWSQRDLAIAVNKSEKLISDYCTNRKRMGLITAKIISSALNCSIDDLYEWVYIGD